MTRPALTKLSRLTATLAVLAFVTLPGPHVAAQSDAPAGYGGGTVTGTGSVTVSRQPNVLRMTMELPAEGKDIKEAMANLKAERATLADKLEKLGASGDAVTFGEPRVGTGPAGGASMQQRMMRQVMRMQRAGNRAAGAKAAAGDDAPPPPKVEVSLTVTAEWPLEEQSPEEFVVAGYTLREKLRAGGLAKAPAAKELTPEEQEEMEEMAGMMDEDEGGAAPGEPSFEFVSRFAAAERDAAMAEAFTKAKADAARVAAAAGGALGELRTVSGNTSAEGGDGDEDIYDYQRAMLRQLGVNAGEAGVEEATGQEPGPVTLQVTVTAAFALK